jgi:acyl-coenzyme A thioesterase PaaI-like protein
MEQRAFQDLIPDNYCYGCGPGNEHGLHLKSRWEGDDAVCTFIPRKHHSAGPRHVLNGGVIATIIDCHSICTAVADHYRREQREIGSAPGIWCVTASLKVDYLHPAAIDLPVNLRARVMATDGKKTTIACSVFSDERECAKGEVLAIRVPPAWRAK